MAEVLLGRYHVVRTLKDTHPVRTVLADDLATGAQVVVKTAAVPQLLAAAGRASRRRWHRNARSRR